MIATEARALQIRVLIGVLGGIACLSLLLAWATLRDLQPVPPSLLPSDMEIRKPQVLDRWGNPLSVTYQNRWSTQIVPFHDIPILLQQAFIQSEDRRFHFHGGADWTARLYALLQNLAAMRVVRGASTITEQVVRILRPRPRTFWSRWLEGFEAGRLERRFSKSEILEFYLNQVPYASQRRGVVQAARFYFDRDLDTLNAKEILALAVLVRAPSGLDLRRNPKAIEKRIAVLAGHMQTRKLLSPEEYTAALSPGFEFGRSTRIVEAPHFVQHILKTSSKDSVEPGGRITTTLDGNLQQKIRNLLDGRLQALKAGGVKEGAVLVVDNASGEVLAWVSGSSSKGEMGCWVDAVAVPRQPGSTLKPFLYALAFELGWTAATLIEDAPLAEPVRSGLHTFQNYSRTYYGPVRLRDALGNSLNTPAVRAIQFTTTERFLERLQQLGMTSLDRGPEHYGHGLALGDGEVSLFELVQAYSVFPRNGEFKPLCTLPESNMLRAEPRRVVDPKAAFIISDILSDPQARRLEFGDSHLLRFPVRTAVKTGTSTDHRDCWAIGFTRRHTAGVWMGNLDRRPTRGISGAIGPALLLRSVFAELDRDFEPSAMEAVIGLKTVSICSKSGMLAGSECPRMDELFERGRAPVRICSRHRAGSDEAAPRSERVRAGDIKLTQPTPDLLLAIDPRVPSELQEFAFTIPKDIAPTRTDWILNGETVGRTGEKESRFLWRMSRGRHQVQAQVWLKDGSNPVRTPQVMFTVK